MGGGLLQLVSYGSQNLYLSGNPQISFFKVVYRRHTNFSMESKRQILYGSNVPGGIIKCAIPQTGDLLNKIYFYLEVETDIPSNEMDIQHIYNNVLTMIDTIILYIGGKQIVKLTGEWINLWFWMTHNIDKFNILNQLALTPSGTEGKLFIPIPFWFCNDIGSAIPLIALQYSELEIEITYSTENNTDYRLYEKCTTPFLWCNYIYLDKAERNWFAKNKHVYLIEQVQHMKQNLGDMVSKYTLDISFNLPIKELIWMVKDPNPIFKQTAEETPDYSTNNMKFLYWNGGIWGKDQIKDVTIYINHCERFKKRSALYYRIIQFYEHHSGGNQCQNHCVYSYSFALEPEKLEPTGSCNFSYIDNPQIEITLEDYAGVSKEFIMYGLNYNVLVIENGMGALVYSN